MEHTGVCFVWKAICCHSYLSNYCMYVCVWYCLPCYGFHQTTLIPFLLLGCCFALLTRKLSVYRLEKRKKFLKPEVHIDIYTFRLVSWSYYFFCKKKDQSKLFDKNLRELKFKDAFRTDALDAHPICSICSLYSLVLFANFIRSFYSLNLFTSSIH